MSFIRNRPLLTGALSLGAAGSTAIYFGKRYLDRACPRVPITQVPTLSACRNLVDSAIITVPYTPHGLEKGCLLPSWSGGRKDDRWIHSFAALQIEVPTALLAGYKGDGSKNDAEHLMQNLLATFLDERSKGPDGWLLDEEVPPLSFRAWESFELLKACNLWLCLQPPLTLSSKFPSNAALVQNTPTDAAGAVMYMHNSAAMVERVDKAADYGLPWRFMLGGFQEWIVEKVWDEKVRVTYVMLECSETKSDFKPMPSPGYEGHVLYGQYLLDGAVREMKRVSLEQKARA